MQFKVPRTDARPLGGSILSQSIIDQDSGKSVGWISISKGFWFGDQKSSAREIMLFHKYRGAFDTHAECVAFAEGVKAVLNHMTSRSEDEAAA